MGATILCKLFKGSPMHRDCSTIRGTFKGLSRQGSLQNPATRRLAGHLRLRASTQDENKTVKELRDLVEQMNSKMNRDLAVAKSLAKKAKELEALKEDGDTEQLQEAEDALHKEAALAMADFKRKWGNGEEITKIKEKLGRRLVVERVMMRLKSLTLSPGLTGTITVLAGRLLHLDPFGGLHWDPHDAVWGLLCILPLLVLELAIMLPDFYGLSEKKIKEGGKDALTALDTEGLQAFPATAALLGQALVERPREQQTSDTSAVASTSGRGAVEAALAAAAAVKGQTIERTVWMRVEGAVKNSQKLFLRRQLGDTTVPLPVDIGVLLSSKFGMVMLEYGLIFAGLAKWVTDRLYEAGLEDTVLVLGEPVAVQRLAAYSALGIMTAVLLTCAAVILTKEEQVHAKQERSVQKKLSEKMRKVMDYKLFRQALKETGVDEPTTEQVAEQLQRSLPASGALHSAVQDLADWKSKDRAAQEAWNVALISLERVLGMWGCGASFILTGNLLAPYCAAVATSGLRTAYATIQTPKLSRKRSAMLSRLKVAVAAQKEISEQEVKDSEASQRHSGDEQGSEEP